MKFFELKPVLAWLLLIGLTAISVLIAESGAAGITPVVLVFLFAAAKSTLVMCSYMEVNYAKPHWRALYTGWVAAIAIVLMIGCIW